MLARLKFQQRVLKLLVFRLDRIGFLGQQHRGFGIALVQFLLHQPPDADEPRAIILQQFAIGRIGPCGIARDLGSLRGQKIGDMRPVKEFLGLRGLVQRKLPLARGDGKHALAKRIISLALARAGEIAADRGFIPRKKTQEGKRQSKQLEHQPCQHHQHKQRDNRLDRRQHDLGTGIFKE